jgi:hypothetical protein
LYLLCISSIAAHLSLRRSYSMVRIISPVASSTVMTSRLPSPDFLFSVCLRFCSSCSCLSRASLDAAQRLLSESFPSRSSSNMALHFLRYFSGTFSSLSVMTMAPLPSCT